MKALKKAIHVALRDDSDATVGLRTLLGQSATAPYGVYEGRWQGVPNFKNAAGPQSYLTWLFLRGMETGTVQTDLQLREQMFAVTAWSENTDTVEAILARARYVLQGRRAVAQPTVDVELHQIRYEGSGPDLFDDKWKVYYRAEHFRAYFREDLAGTVTTPPAATVGLYANRPSADVGSWYYSTDLGILEYSDGTTWRPVLTG